MCACSVFLTCWRTDRMADGAYRYPLCEWERADLPRLHGKILHGILLPADHRELLVP